MPYIKLDLLLGSCLEVSSSAYLTLILLLIKGEGFSWDNVSSDEPSYSVFISSPPSPLDVPRNGGV